MERQQAVENSLAAPITGLFLVMSHGADYVAVMVLFFGL
jgi:hypothetical protein